MNDLVIVGLTLVAKRKQSPQKADAVRRLAKPTGDLKHKKKCRAQTGAGAGVGAADRNRGRAQIDQPLDF